VLREDLRQCMKRLDMIRSNHDPLVNSRIFLRVSLVGDRL
jgi:hypothetical protein